MMRVAGLFDSNVREMVEMLYQSDYEYIFDSSKFTRATGIHATPYARAFTRPRRPDYQGRDRATEMPRISLDHVPDTAQ